MHISNVTLTDVRAFVLEKSIEIKNKPPENTPKPSEYTQTVYGSYNYQKSLQRAFSHVKQQVFFNPDMQYFVTLTYKGKDHTPEQVLYDLKQLFKKLRRNGIKPKYAAVLEYQKRGSIHVHMITNDLGFTENIKKGKFNLPTWTKGFSDVKHISDFDNNFKPFLYLFKYMKKSQRIGKHFVYTSRNLNHFSKLPIDYFDIKLYTELNRETATAYMPNGKPVTYTKYYFERVK